MPVQDLGGQEEGGEGGDVGFGNAHEGGVGKDAEAGAGVVLYGGKIVLVGRTSAARTTAAEAEKYSSSSNSSSSGPVS